MTDERRDLEGWEETRTERTWNTVAVKRESN